MVWWWRLNSSGSTRALRNGTFGVSVYSSLGAESLHPLSPVTSTINYGVIDENGDVTTRIVYDHRVLDGAMIARALSGLEQVLNTAIVAELEAMAAEQAREKKAA